VLCLLLIGRITKKKRESEKEKKMARELFPKVGHALLAVLCGIFMAVR
jgi:hypothetical protein